MKYSGNHAKNKEKTVINVIDSEESDQEAKVAKKMRMEEDEHRDVVIGLLSAAEQLKLQKRNLAKERRIVLCEEEGTLTDCLRKKKKNPSNSHGVQVTIKGLK